MVPNTKHNFYWLQIDDACGINVSDSDTMAPNTWTWVAYKDGDTTQPIIRDLAQGVHTVKLVGREPNVQIDSLVFAKDLSCIPVDTGTNCATDSTTDTTAPSVISTVPAANATGVAATTNVTATFSEDMDQRTLTTSTFTLTKQGSSIPVAATVSYDSANKKATLDPATDLEANTSYTARVTGGSSGAKDLAGNALAQDYSWTFATPTPPPDTTAPKVGTVSSANTTTRVASSTDIASTFSEKMNQIGRVRG